MVWKKHVLLIPYGNGPKLAQHFIIDSGDLSVLSNDARNLIGCRDLWVQRSEGKRKVLLLSTKIGLRWNMVTQRLGLMIFVRRGIMKANPCYNEFCDY